MSSKLSLILFGIIVLAAIAAAMDDDDDYSEDELEEYTLERAARDAEPDAREQRKRKKKTNKRKKKARKGKKGQKGKNGKKGKKGRGRKRNNNSRKRPRGGKSGRASSSSSLDDSCYEKSLTYMRIWRDIIANYDKAYSRMTKQNNTGGSKSGKKGVFAPIAFKLIDIGGGNKSNLSCGGSYSSSGAKQLTNLTKTLFDCEINVNKSCNPANFPQPNMTFINLCNNLTTTFKTQAGSCLTKAIGFNGTKTNSTDACKCFTDSVLNTTVNALKSCKINNEAKAISKQLTACKSAFSTCRQYEDAAGTAISTCSQTSSKLLTKAANLKTNSDEMTKAKTTMSSLANGTSSGRVRRATAASCAEVITKSATLITYASEFPQSTKIATLAKEISGSSSITCTTSQQSTMSTQVTSMTSAISNVDSALSAVQTQISTLTGSTASTSVLSSNSGSNSTSSSTAASSGRRERLVRNLMMNKL